MQFSETLPKRGDDSVQQFEVVAEIIPKKGVEAVERRYLCCLNGDDNHQLQSMESIIDTGYGNELGNWLSLDKKVRRKRSVQYMEFQHKYKLMSVLVGQEGEVETEVEVDWNVITANQIATAVKLTFPGELSKLAVETGEASVSNLNMQFTGATGTGEGDGEVDDEEETPKMQFLLNNYKAYKEQEEGNIVTQEEEEEEEEKDLCAIMYTLGGLTNSSFPVARVGKNLVRNARQSVSLSATIYLAAVLE